MNPEPLRHNSEFCLKDGSRTNLLPGGEAEPRGFMNGHLRQPDWVGSPEMVAEGEAQRFDSQDYRYLGHQKVLAPQSTMTIAEFVERKFVPGHVALKEFSGQAHYQAMLRHVLLPEEVDRAFRVNPRMLGKRLRAIPEWPYLSSVRLCDARPDHVHRLASAALERGYSSQTVVHIRNVVSAIFAHAKRVHCFAGESPVTPVKPPEITRKHSFALTLSQVNQSLSLMKYPEREMLLLSIFSDLNVTEICGLQSKRINLSETAVSIEGEQMPPRTVAVRKQWIRGELRDVKKGRIRNLPIPPALLNILRRLHDRRNSPEPDDYVLVSRVGTPVNQTNIVARRLNFIARKLGVTSLSWQVFHRTRKALTSEFGTQFQNSATISVASLLPRETLSHKRRDACIVK
jgi:integrase